MKQMQLSLEEISTSILFIGFEGEQNHTQVTFYWSSIYSKYPNAVAALTIKPPVGDPYPKAITQTGNKVVWVVSASDVANSGSGEYQLTFTDDGEIIKTYIGKFNVYNSIVGNGEAPTPVEDWVYRANEALAEIPGRVKDATDEWLEENISNPDSPPLDRSLSSSAAAAPADLVGDLKRAEKAPVITDTVENSDIATFTDGADGMHLKNLVVEINPVQDLNGYDYPYPSGGYGVQQWDEEWETGTYNTTTGEPQDTELYFRSKNMIPVLPNTMYYANTGSDRIYRFWYDSSKQYISYEGSIANVRFTAPEGAYFLNIVNVSRNEYNPSTNPISINYPSTDTNYYPWKNICPIAGWTGCNVTRTGANLISLDDLISASQGVIGSYLFKHKLYLQLEPNTDYTLMTTYDGDNNVLYFDGVTSNDTVKASSPKTRTSNSSGQLIVGLFDRPGIEEFENETVIVVLCKATEKQTYPVTWQDEAGTVYGGTVDVSTGVLTVKYIKYICRSPVNVETASTGVKYAQKTLTTAGMLEDDINAISSEYRFRKGSAPSDPGWFRIVAKTSLLLYDNRFVNKATAEAIIEEEQPEFCYELETPVEVQLDPVAVATLLGVNNIYADTGAIQSVTYPADTKLYIDKRLAALGGN